MGWGGRSRVVQPDTSREEAELRRQLDAMMAQFEAFMNAQTQLFNDQRAADETRYTSQRAADLAEAERQRAELLRLYETQQADQAEINRRMEEERAYAQEQADLRATRSRQYGEGRSALIDQAAGALDAVYGGFDDGYYDAYQTALVNAARPEIDRGYKEDRRSARLALADNGILNSSAGARAVGKVTEGYKSRLGQLAGGASDAATRLREQIEGQKRSALANLINSAGVADPNLAEYETDVGGALSGITARLNSYLSDVTQQVRTYVPMGGSGSVQFPQITAPQVTLNPPTVTSGTTSGLTGNNLLTGLPTRVD